MPSRNAILIFLKHPEPGKVKTRLAATVGAERAAAIYRLLAREVFQRLPQDAEIIVMFDPPEREAEIRAWIHSIQPSHATQFVAQRGPGLGERLNHAFAQALAQGFQKVAAIGTVNPRSGGLANALVQKWKRLVSRILDWHVREQVEFNRKTVACVDAALWPALLPAVLLGSTVAVATPLMLPIVPVPPVAT